LKNKVSKEEIIKVWNEFKSKPQELKLPFAPERPIYYFTEDKYPQPRLHRLLDKGMAVAVGRLRDCNLFDYKFTVLSHNTIRGAAGGSILCGEILIAENMI
jgi:aspartate-semialdehyde dehydrogenase